MSTKIEDRANSLGVDDSDWKAALPDGWRQSEIRGGAAGYADTLGYETYADGRVALKGGITPYFEITPEGIVYTFHPGQSKVMQSVKRFIIACAGRQGGKCGRFKVLLRSGRRAFVKDVRVGDEILSLDEQTQKIKPAFVTAIFDNGTKPTYRVTTKTGREIVVTANHPLYSKTGWKETTDFQEGEFIAVPRHLPIVPLKSHPANEMKLMGYFLGDGGISAGACRFSNIDEVILDDLRTLIPDTHHLKRFGETCDYCVTAKQRYHQANGCIKKHPLMELFREWGICTLAKEKKIPDFVFELGAASISPMLSRLFSCDGWIDDKGIGICLASKGMVRDIQHLLLRYGILSRIRHKPSKCGGRVFDAWDLCVRDFDSIVRFSKQIGIFSKQEKLDRLIQKKQTEHAMTYNRKDVVPNFPLSECDSQTRRAYRSLSVSRHNAQKVADEFGIGAAHAYSDIYWDSIRSIEYLGDEPTYDIEVKGPHNFIADDIFAHNTVDGPPWMLDEMIERGPGMYMVVAPSFPLLEDSALPRFMDLFWRGLHLGELKHNPLRFIISPEGEKWLWEGTKWEGMPNKGETVVRFAHGSNSASLEAKTVLAAWVDEAGQNEFKPESFEAIEGRLTTTRGRCLFTSTPYAMNAFYRKYYLPWLKARNAKMDGAGKPCGEHPTIDFISWPSYMNPAFPREEYDRLKETMPAWKHAMFYDGQFTRPAGQIYDCFSETNLCEPFEVPEDWPLMLGMDFGGSNTCAITVAQNPDTLELFQFAEYLGGNQEPSEHIKNFTGKHLWHPAPDSFDRAFGGQNSEKSWRMWYRSEGLWIEEPPIVGGGSVELGIDAVYSFVAKGLFKVFKDCEGTIGQFYTYSREIDPETGEPKPGTIADKASFHYLDSLRALLGGLARTSAVYEAALQRRALDETESYIARGERKTRAALREPQTTDPRFSDEDILEGILVDEGDYGGASDTADWAMRNGILLPGAAIRSTPGNVSTQYASPLGIGGLPLPF